MEKLNIQPIIYVESWVLALAEILLALGNAPSPLWALVSSCVKHRVGSVMTILLANDKAQPNWPGRKLR